MVQLLGSTPLEAIVAGDVHDSVEDKNESVMTDENGLTKAFEIKGRYAVASRYAQGIAGEWDGKKYEKVRRIASIVFDFP